jgi:hypothetical protein
VGKSLTGWAHGISPRQEQPRGLLDRLFRRA